MSGYASGRLGSYVHVVDDDGHRHVFGPSSEVPEWAAKKITNKRAWATAPTFPAVTGTDPDGDGSGQGGDAVTGEVPARPPTSGKGSGVDVWRAHAEARGIAILENASRDDIVAKVDKADAELAAKRRAENDAAVAKLTEASQAAEDGGE